MKKIISIGLCILLLPLVLGFEEGQIITQEQLDNLDLNLVTWSFLQCEGSYYPLFIPYALINPYTCLNLHPYEENNYIIVRDQYETWVSYEAAFHCLLNYDFTICKERFKAEVRKQALETVDDIRLNLEEHQTKPTNDDVLRLFEDLFGGM